MRSPLDAVRSTRPVRPVDAVRPVPVRLPLTPGYLATFAALSFLALGAHELIHHLVGGAVCGAWGTMSFSRFALDASCSDRRLGLLATLAGPALTYLLMYAGVLAVRRGRALAGATLILANLPLARFVTVLMRGGDELVLGRALLPGWAAWPALLALTVLLLATPLVTLWRALEPRGRAAALAGFLVLPLFWDMLVKRVLLARALEALPAAVGGVPHLVLAVDALVALALIALVAGNGSGSHPPAAPGRPRAAREGGGTDPART